MTNHDPHRSIEAVWRLESTRLLGALVRIVRDIGRAEDLAQDALVAALAQWPESGVPANPGAWLLAVAKRRAIDSFRRDERQDRAYAQVGESLEQVAGGIETAVDHVEDDVLRLMFLCCHPCLTPDAQVTLALRLLAGLTVKQIARSFLTLESTVGQRITRAKRSLADARATTEEPGQDERAERLSAVLGVLYLLFTEGYSATGGDDWMRPALCEEALRLGRVLAGLVPREPEVHGLVALMEIQSSRTAARIGTGGQPVLLQDQDRGRWDRLLIRRGLAALERAESLTATPGTYVLQAAIAACHARAATAHETNWKGIAALYAALVAVTGSPVVELNRGIAVSRAYGPVAGLEVLDLLRDRQELRGYHLLPSARGDLLVQLGRVEQAREEFERAAAKPTSRSGGCFSNEPRERDSHGLVRSEPVIGQGRFENCRSASSSRSATMQTFKDTLVGPGSPSRHRHAPSCSSGRNWVLGRVLAPGVTGGRNGAWPKSLRCQRTA